VDAELLVACSNATVVEVKAALRKGASVNALDKDGQTGLMLACGRAPREAVVPIVELLLRKRFSVALPDGDGWNALHFACLNSLANVVLVLLEADKAAVLRLTGSNMSCLVLCAQGGDRAESLRIATMLIDAGCPVNLPNSSARPPSCSLQCTASRKWFPCWLRGELTCTREAATARAQRSTLPL
jgi:hypothetical protein